LKGLWKVAAMSFAKGNERVSDNPFMPRRDRSVSATRSKAPPVPKAPRPAQKPNSAGAFTNEHRRVSPASSGYTAGMIPKSSEERRPREESPFARINMLSRERESNENQEIEVGPARRRSERPPSGPSSDQPDFRRGHVLGKETNAQAGIHWSSVTTGEEPAREPGRRQVMQREFQDATQGFEWLPEAAKPLPLAHRDHSRKSTLAREQAAAADESHPDHVPASKANGNFARRNVLSRENADVGGSMAKISGTEEGGAPMYRRRNSLEYVAGIGGS